MSNSDESDEEKFTTLLENISAEITRPEFASLKRLCKKIPRGKLDEMKKAGELFLQLEDMNIISPTDTAYLCRILRTKSVGRGKLADKLETFSNGRTKPSGDVQADSAPTTSSETADNMAPSSRKRRHDEGEKKSAPKEKPTPRDDAIQPVYDACNVGNNNQRGVLLINDEWGTAKGGISTVNRQLAEIIALCNNMQVYCTSLYENEKDKEDARERGVELVFPKVEQSSRNSPNLDWLEETYRSYFYHLVDIPNIDIIVGHVPITSGAALNIRNAFFPKKKLYLFIHVIPRDIEIHKVDWSPQKVEVRENKIIEEVKKCNCVFSVGPRIYSHFDNGFRCLNNIKHHEFLPSSDSQFFDVIIKEPTIEESDLNVLTFGRVSGVGNLKGYDIVAKALSMVANHCNTGRRTRQVRTIWKIRGISEGEHNESKAYVDANITSPNIQWDMRPYGTQDDIRRDIQQSHLVIMASRSEPFGMVGLEAIAAGVPVLITVNSGLAEFLLKYFPLDMVSQIIVKVGVNDHQFEMDIERWYNEIIEVINNYPIAFDRAQHLKGLLQNCDAVKTSHEFFKRECT